MKHNLEWNIKYKITQTHAWRSSVYPRCNTSGYSRRCCGKFT